MVPQIRLPKLTIKSCYCLSIGLRLNKPEDREECQRIAESIWGKAGVIFLDRLSLSKYPVPNSRLLCSREGKKGLLACLLLF